jgi:hypothetical protein
MGCDVSFRILIQQTTIRKVIVMNTNGDCLASCHAQPEVVFHISQTVAAPVLS